MIDYSGLYRLMRDTPLERWAELLPEQLEAEFFRKPHGDFDRWVETVHALPHHAASRVDLNAAAIRVEGDRPLDRQERETMVNLLQRLHPWRKGPYSVHGIHIDTEWRSDWKWDRVLPHLSPLKGRTILDVGCGNGYHGWRMAGEGARLVIGIDPTHLFLAQFLAMRHFIGEAWPVHLLPLAMEQIPANLRGFDTLFSMGVLYHRRSPVDHIYELKGALRQGGELVLETLVIDGHEGEVLVPKGRYAKMRNVWFIPTAGTLAGWLERCGFSDVRIADITTTTVEEQRGTEWMRFESLPDYLDPGDRSRTVEGLPAPKRAILIARSN
jgi:tRNA (mo5U34)-methyltransferase